MSFENKSVSRRQALTGAAVLTAASVASCSQSSVKEATPAKKDLILDYKNPKWNRDALARIHGNTDFSKEKIGWYKGKAIGVVPGKKNIEICGFEGFSVCLLYTSPSPRDATLSRMPSSA